MTLFYGIMRLFMFLYIEVRVQNIAGFAHFNFVHDESNKIISLCVISADVRLKTPEDKK